MPEVKTSPHFVVLVWLPQTMLHIQTHPVQTTSYPITTKRYVLHILSFNVPVYLFHSEVVKEILHNRNKCFCVRFLFFLLMCVNQWRFETHEMRVQQIQSKLKFTLFTGLLWRHVWFVKYVQYCFHRGRNLHSTGGGKHLRIWRVSWKHVPVF